MDEGDMSVYNTYTDVEVSGLQSAYTLPAQHFVTQHTFSHLSPATRDPFRAGLQLCK